MKNIFNVNGIKKKQESMHDTAYKVKITKSTAGYLEFNEGEPVVS